MIHDAETELSVCVSLLGRLEKPTHSLRAVLLHTLAQLEHETEWIVSLRESLFGCFMEPSHCLREVFLHVINDTEVVLRFGMSCLGDLVVQVESLVKFLAAIVPKVVLSFGIH